MENSCMPPNFGLVTTGNVRCREYIGRGMENAVHTKLRSPERHTDEMIELYTTTRTTTLARRRRRDGNGHFFLLLLRWPFVHSFQNN